MDREQALHSLAEVQLGLEAMESDRDLLVARARAAGATWEEIARATRMALTTAHTRWRPGRRRLYGVPIPAEVPRDKRRVKEAAA
jgi:hypothetical protein